MDGVAEPSRLREDGDVADSCTCGAQLPPDARFCHKCGKPQYDSPEPEPEQAEPPPAAAVDQPPPPAEINFRNSAAVRVSMMAAALASLLISIPVPVFAPVWLLAWLVGAGFMAVLFYRRRTRLPLSVRAGARMGWITGVFCFVIATVFFTISVVAIASQGGLADFYRQQLNARGAPQANMEQFLEVLQSPGGLASVVLMSLLFLFLFFTALPMLGGALGAKLLDRD